MAMAEAHRVHVFGEHTEGQRAAMVASQPGLRMANGDAPTAFLIGVPLPRWWVDR